MYHNWGCTSIDRSLSYPFRSLAGRPSWDRLALWNTFITLAGLLDTKIRQTSKVFLADKDYCLYLVTYDLFYSNE